MTQDHPNQPNYPNEQSSYSTGGEDAVAAFGEHAADPATQYSSTPYSATTDYSTTEYTTTDPTPYPPAGGSGGSGGSSGTADTAKEQASNVADTAKQAGAQVAGTAKEQAGNVASEAKNQARDLLHQTRGEVTQQVTSQQQRVATGIRSLGDELKSMAQNSQQQGLASQLARRVGDQTNQVAGFLENREPADLLNEVRTFARRRPGAFLLAAAGAGLLAGRLTRGAVADAKSDDSDSSGYRQTTNYNTGSYNTGTQDASSYTTPGSYDTGSHLSGTSTGGSYGTGSGYSTAGEYGTAGSQTDGGTYGRTEGTL